MNDIDIIVGLSDLATKGLTNLESRVRSMSERSQSALTQMSNAGIDQFQRLAESVSKQGLISPQAVAKLETALNGIGAKIEASVAQTNASIESTTQKITGVISAISNFVKRAATIATVTAAFITVGRGIMAANGAIASAAMGLNRVDQSAVKAKTSVLGSLAPFAKYAVAAGATATLTKATIDATSATTGLTTKAMAIGRGALAAFVLRNAMKKTEDGASTLGAKLAKVASFALAFDVVARASIRFGLGLLGLKKKSDDVNQALMKTSVTSKAINSVGYASVAATLPLASLTSKIEDLPKGADTLNTISVGFGNITSSIQKTVIAAGEGIPVLGALAATLIGVPAALAGVALAAYTAAGKTERQIVQLTNKLALIEAAKLNISIDDIDTSKLRAASEEVEATAKRIQLATNTQSSKLLTLATNNIMKGLDTSQIGPALTAATGLSEVFGTSLEEAMYKVRQAMDGNFESFERIIPSLATMTTQEEKLAAVTQLAANGFKLLEKDSKTLFGTIEKVKNGLGNVLESMGRMKSLSDVIGTVISDVVTPAVMFLDSKLKGFGFDGKKVLDQAASIGAGVVGAVEMIANNWTTVVDRMSLSSSLFWEQLKSHAVSFVNNTLPWLATNFEALFEHAFANISKKFSDQAKVMANAAAEAYGLAAKGSTDKMISDSVNKKKNEFVPKALTEFKGRDIGDKEKELLQKLEKLDGQLRTSFQESYDKAKTSIKQTLDQAIQPIKPDPLKPSQNQVKKEPEATADKVGGRAQQSDAFQSRMLSRAPSRDPQVEMVQILKQINAHQAKIAAAEKEKRDRGQVAKPKLEVEVIA